MTATRGITVGAYPDTGCAVSPSCLRCPLAECRYDSELSERAAVRLLRDQDIRRRARHGQPILAIAIAIGVSERTVFRALAQREAPP